MGKVIWYRNKNISKSFKGMSIKNKLRSKIKDNYWQGIIKRKFKKILSEYFSNPSDLIDFMMEAIRKN